MQLVSLILIDWIVIYEVDSTIQRFNYWVPMFNFSHQVLPKLRLWEFFSVDVKKTVEQFRRDVLNSGGPAGASSSTDSPPLKLTTGKSYQRFSATVDLAKALEKFNKER